MTPHQTRTGVDARGDRALLLRVAWNALRQADRPIELADVASAAGLSIDTVNRHFRTRTALLEAVAREEVAHLLHNIAARAITLHDNPLQALIVLLHDLLNVHYGQPEISRMLMGTVAVHSWTARARTTLDVAIATVLARAQQAGRIRGDVTAADLRQLVYGIELARNPRDKRAYNRAYLHLSILTAGLKHL